MALERHAAGYAGEVSAVELSEELGVLIGREYTLIAEGDGAELETFYSCVSFTGADYLFGYRKSDLPDGEQRVFAGQFTLHNDEDRTRFRELTAGLDGRGISWRLC